MMKNKIKNIIGDPEDWETNEDYNIEEDIPKIPQLKVKKFKLNEKPINKKKIK